MSKGSFRNAFGVPPVKAKNTFVKPETVHALQAEMDGPLQFAFSYNPVRQPGAHAADPLEFGFPRWWNNIRNDFEQRHGCLIELYPEVSSMGRWHFHGYIIITDILKFYTIDVPFLIQIGSCEMDTIDLKNNVWFEYVFKSQEFIQPHVLKELTCPITGIEKHVAYLNSDMDCYAIKTTHTYEDPY